MASENGDRLIWFLAGASIGAAIALLYAPASGEETRKILKKKASEGGSVLTDQGKEFVSRGKELYEKGQAMAEEAAELLEKGRSIIEGRTSVEGSVEG